MDLSNKKISLIIVHIEASFIAISRGRIKSANFSDSVSISKASFKTLPGASESTPKDAAECTSDSYKKTQVKMKQQILEAPLSTFDEKIKYTDNTSTSQKKGRMHSNLKT